MWKQHQTSSKMSNQYSTSEGIKDGNRKQNPYRKVWLEERKHPEEVSPSLKECSHSQPLVQQEKGQRNKLHPPGRMTERGVLKKLGSHHLRPSDHIQVPCHTLLPSVCLEASSMWCCPAWGCPDASCQMRVEPWVPKAATVAGTVGKARNPPRPHLKGLIWVTSHSCLLLLLLLLSRFSHVQLCATP